MRNKGIFNKFFSMALIILVALCFSQISCVDKEGGDIMEPESKKVLSETEINDVVNEVANEILTLKPQYPHLKSFSPKNIRGLSIRYKNNVESLPNPDYAAALKKREQNPQLKMQLPAEEISQYAQEDGIELYIHFISYENFKSSARMWAPVLWIGNYAVDLSAQGAKTEEIKEIREKIIQILLEVKEKAEREAL